MYKVYIKYTLYTIKSDPWSGWLEHQPSKWEVVGSSPTADMKCSCCIFLRASKLDKANTNENQAKEKYRGMFEMQKSGDKTKFQERLVSTLETHASPKVGQDQVSGGVSVLCWHAAPVAYVLWKPCTIR